MNRINIAPSRSNLHLRPLPLPASRAVRTLHGLLGAVLLPVSLSAANLAQNPAVNNTAAVNELVCAINAAETAGTPTTINLFSNGVYTLTTPDNWEYGPNGLPQITGCVTINGQGATILRATNAPNFRFFYVSGGLSYNAKKYTGLPAGTLNLLNLTLSGGSSQGGNGFGQGGGGAGMGGAIFNQGTLGLTNVNLVGNTALGGSTVTNGFGGGGGGLGSGANSCGGGGFGGGFQGVGGKGGIGAAGGGGGGGGFRPVDSGAPATSKTAGNGGGLGTLGTIGDGGTGGFAGIAGGGENGGAYGLGGLGIGGNGSQSGGGGGIGGGGGHGGFNGGDGSGGFGGGGGGGAEVPGDGGFGGGGGSGNGGSSGGFAAGNGNPEDAGGGGGGGMGGAIFNHRGSVTMANCLLTGNSAGGGAGFDDLGMSIIYGGVGGSGYGGGIFNLNGTVLLCGTTVISNATARGATTAYRMTGPNQFVWTNLPSGQSDGGALYNLAFGDQIETGAASAATVTIANSLLSSSIGSANDLVNNTIYGAQTNTATVNYCTNSLVCTSTAMPGATCSGDAAGAVCDHVPASGTNTPALAVTVVANHPVIFWSTNFNACSLQSSTTLPTSAGNWTTMTCTPGVTAGQFVIPDAPATGNRFYRLVSH